MLQIDVCNSLRVGSRVWFTGEKRPYTVQARSRRYVVCTKPFAARKTVLYTVIDCENSVRGTEDLVFGLGAETREQCENMVKRLDCGATGISRRNNVPLSIDKAAV